MGTERNYQPNPNSERQIVGIDIVDIKEICLKHLAKVDAKDRTFEGIYLWAIFIPIEDKGSESIIAHLEFGRLGKFDEKHCLTGHPFTKEGIIQRLSLGDRRLHFKSKATSDSIPKET